MESKFSPEFIQEWEDMIKYTGGDYNLIADRGWKKYNDRSKFKNLLDIFKNSNERTGESNDLWTRSRLNVVPASRIMDVFRGLGPNYSNYPSRINTGSLRRSPSNEEDLPPLEDDYEDDPPMEPYEETTYESRNGPVRIHWYAINENRDLRNRERLIEYTNQLSNRNRLNYSTGYVNSSRISRDNSGGFTLVPDQLYENNSEDNYERSRRLFNALHWGNEIQEEPTQNRLPVPRSEPSLVEQFVEETVPNDVNARDVELVMAQTNVSQDRAVRALRHHDGDIVNAIMSLQF